MGRRGRAAFDPDGFIERLEALKARKAAEKQQKTAPLPTTPPENRTRTENRTPPENKPPAPPVSAAAPLRKEPVLKTGGAKLLPADDPHLRVPHVVINEFRRLKTQPRVVLEELYRASAGWHSDECIISIGKLTEHTGIKKTQIQAHLKYLQSKGYITRLPDVLGGDDPKARGMRIRVHLPRLTRTENRTGPENRPPRKTVPNKEERIKEIEIKPPAPEDEAEYNAARAALEGKGGG